MPLPHRKRPGRKPLNGLPVYDAILDQSILVRHKHILGACPKSMCECAVARAAKDMGFVDALVSPNRVWLREAGCDYWLRFVIHWPERTIIRNFDHENGFPTDLIAVYAPTASHRLGRAPAKNKRPEVPKTTNNKRRAISLRHWPTKETKIDPPTVEARNRILKAHQRYLDSQL